MVRFKGGWGGAYIFDVWIYPRSNFNLEAADEKCLIASFVGQGSHFCLKISIG